MITHFTTKDNRKRQKCLKYEWKKIALKSIAQNMSLSDEIRFKARLDLTELPRDCSKVRVRNRCIITGRSRGVYRFWRISRIKIRELMAENKIPGLRKSSW